MLQCSFYATTLPPVLFRIDLASSRHRDGVWPVAVEVIPGPQYFPRVSTTAINPNGIPFPKEERFLSTMIRYVSPGHERQALGSSSPGPARYGGHDERVPVVPQSCAPPASCLRRKISRVSPRE